MFNQDSDDVHGMMMRISVSSQLTLGNCSVCTSLGDTRKEEMIKDTTADTAIREMCINCCQAEGEQLRKQ